MEIYLSPTAGFCDGVKRAYEMIESLDMKTIATPVRILGNLVHNPDVVKKIEENGIVKISLEELSKAEKGEIGTLIITAHGIGPDVFEIARKKKITVIDTTCPRVIKVQRLAQVFAVRDYEIVLVGDKLHNEVEGIHAWGNRKAQIVSDRSELEKLKLAPDKKVAVISQTTQNEEFFREACAYVGHIHPQVEIFSTICHATHDRQTEIKKLAEKFETVIVIGSPMSANSTRLYEISQALNPRTFFVENASEIKLAELKDAKSIAVMAGASTPSWVIQEVMDLLFSDFKL